MKPRKRNENTNLKLVEWMYYSEFGRFVNEDGEEFFIDNRLKKLLNSLINNQDSIITRNEIIESVWDEVQVNEENLTKGIFDLRKILKEKKITELEIETIRNIGYRLNIQKEKVRVNTNPIFHVLLKSILYFVLFASFLIMFIRAIRYEN